MPPSVARGHRHVHFPRRGAANTNSTHLAIASSKPSQLHPPRSRAAGTRIHRTTDGARRSSRSASAAAGHRTAAATAHHDGDGEAEGKTTSSTASAMSDASTSSSELLERYSDTVDLDVIPQWLLAGADPAATGASASASPSDDAFAAIPEAFVTPSLALERSTADECLPFLLNLPHFPDDSSDEQSGEHPPPEPHRPHAKVNAFGLPHLERSDHADFLRRLLRRLPAGFQSLDASRPWMPYWCLNGLALLGENTGQYRDALVKTLRAIQNPSGGFGGGYGQFSHLATTYAALLCTLIVNNRKFTSSQASRDVFESIDRRAMWQWLGQLKQPEGDFEVCVGGERDVRGAYCAMTIITLLNLPLELPASSPARIRGDETFLTGLAEYVSRCQTYEGGLGSVPNAEAHGAYTFCGLACLCIIDEPQKIIPKHLDLDNLVHWLALRQHMPEGGLAGRTNKLVDGCYSHWIGGCWRLVEAATSGLGFEHKYGQLFNRHELIRYILCCCQSERYGGLRDKPSKPPDAYHTCYNLAGLSQAQNHYTFQPVHDSSPETFNDAPPTSGKDLKAASAWKAWGKAKHWHDFVDEGGNKTGQVFPREDRVRQVHPVYVVPMASVKAARDWYGEKPTVDFTSVSESGQDAQGS